MRLIVGLCLFTVTAVVLGSPFRVKAYSSIPIEEEGGP